MDGLGLAASMLVNFEQGMPHDVLVSVLQPHALDHHGQAGMGEAEKLPVADGLKAKMGEGVIHEAIHVAVGMDD